MASIRHFINKCWCLPEEGLTRLLTQFLPPRKSAVLYKPSVLTVQFHTVSDCCWTRRSVSTDAGGFHFHSTTSCCGSHSLPSIRDVVKIHIHSLESGINACSSWHTDNNALHKQLIPASKKMLSFIVQSPGKFIHTHIRGSVAKW